MSKIRTYYKVLRTLLFSAVILVVATYVLLYILISVPGMQRSIKERVCKELSNYLGGEVSIGSLDIRPFNEVRLSEVSLKTPSGEECLHIGTVGAGIHLWRLISDRKIEITYGEFLDLDAKLWQDTPESSLNIQFIIDAVSPKDKTKPPTLFDLTIHNIVIRRSRFSFDKRWIPETGSADRFNPAHIAVKDLKADITLPRIKNNDFDIDIRRLAFLEKSGFNVKGLILRVAITDKSISCPGISLNIGESILKTSSIDLSFKDFKSLPEALETGNHHLGLIGENVNPSDFKAFADILEKFPGKYYLDLELSGNTGSLDIDDFDVRDRNSRALIKLRGNITDILKPGNLKGAVEALKLELPSDYTAHALRNIPGIPESVSGLLRRIGEIDLEINGDLDMSKKNVSATGSINTSLGNVTFSGVGDFPKSSPNLTGDINTDRFDLGILLDITELGNVAANINADLKFGDKIPEGTADVTIDYIDFRNHSYQNLWATVTKEGNEVTANVNIDDTELRITAEGNAILDGVKSKFDVQASVDELNPGSLGVAKPGTSIKGNVVASLTGNSENNILGTIDLNDFIIALPGKKPFSLSRAHVGLAEMSDSSDSAQAGLKDERHILPRQFVVESDIINVEGHGIFNTGTLIGCVFGLAHTAVPSLINMRKGHVVSQGDNYLNLRGTVKANENLWKYLNIPVRPLTDINMTASYESRSGIMRADIEAPYILQGSNKLITDTNVHLYADTVSGATLKLFTTVPVKHGRASLDLNLSALRDHADGLISWTTVQSETGKGTVSLNADFSRSPQTMHPVIDLRINPSSFTLGKAEWQIGAADLLYADKELEITDLRIWHDKQFIEIGGRASVNAEDILKVDLAGIDLDYIFDLLNIEYVSFGGTATGRITASSVFSRSPVATTEFLQVKNISYNDAVLGNADISSRWNNEKKEVELYADIRNDEGGGAIVDGGIFLTRDSLSFSMDADKVDIRFLKPFMAAFTSDVGGRASGKMMLFGTFKDIDLVGRAYADSICMKVDYTNVYYHGCDSVIMEPGMIRIPGFTLKDKYGHTALLTGFVKHSYFHNPEFEFRLTGARELLCYDTNARMNPDWYGTIYADGRGTLRGRPGLVAIDMDMTTSPDSEFTFVLNETQTALDYNFLTFSDRNKEEMELSGNEEETIESQYLKPKENKEEKPSVFAMDLRVTATPGAKMILVMDPKAGDKIVARGGGPLQISYDTESDQMKMYGKYTLAQGNYNFSLQELILRDFIIKEGSSISFNGDPLQALLNIQAAYRVNTNLSDLDKSFSTDRDLNRTNVPVDALLNVTGNLQSPDISFDISLPTLTSDVERKVKSIISTDDMLSRQIIYLLALNKFYTPEYMSTSGNGGELASVASSTISSQLSNIMGQLTDKVTLSPSFRSDKGDFSDMEVDLSLSSRLLNNRLLINGNFGYRDRSTSMTTFVGDFDIEYLLNRNGGLRLKAYNHFNDQNYYLKSSLTTQGLGIIYRRDFDNPFTFLKHKGKNRNDKDEEHEGEEINKPDSVVVPKEPESILYEK